MYFRFDPRTAGEEGWKAQTNPLSNGAALHGC